MDLSVVVATFQDPLGLYLTTYSLLFQLQKTSLNWEIIIAADAGTETMYERLPNTRCLRLTGGQRTGSPQGTRDAGIRAALAKTVLCIESHVVVDNILEFWTQHLRLGGAMTFPARVGEGTSLFSVYGTTTNWEGNLWFRKTLYSPLSDKPYRVPQFGHSCFMLDRDAYIAVGGYTNLLTGWGGEESSLCLKFWMLGHTLWQTPNIRHAHYLADRTNGAMQSDAFARNFAITKYVLTGNVSDGLQVTGPMRAERQRIMDGPFAGDINKLRAYFRAEGIAD